VNPAAAAAAAVLAVTVALCGVVGIAVTTTLTTAAAGCGSAGADGVTARWSQEQVTNATTIVAVGAGMHVPPYGWVIAIATAIQESGLRNIDYGDRDSLGLFQQRPSQGWGTPAQIMDPTYAAAAFYRTLLAIPGWQQLPLTVAAQRVQVSAFPDAYAAHETEARQLVDTIAAHLGLSVGC
jgi:hypothetical protein